MAMAGRTQPKIDTFGNGSAAQICLIITLQTFQISSKFSMSKLAAKQDHKGSKQPASLDTSLPPATPAPYLPGNSLPEPTVPTYPYPSSQAEQKVIPGYNFQSLFRKKSHIKLSKKKHREQSSRRAVAKSQAAERQCKNIQKGHWSQQESRQYHFFLEIHNRHFILKHLRRTDKIFKAMASFIKSREAEQCRSHHQKMEKKYHNFYHILIKLRMDFYATLNPDQLAADLTQRGYKIRDTRLITEEELKNGDLQSKEQKQDRADPLDSEELPSPSQQNNILSENYENDLDFNRMHFEP